MHARQLNKACNSSRNHAAKAALDQIKQDVEVHQLNLQGSSTLPTRVPCGAGQHALCRTSPTGQSNLQSPSMLPLSLLQSGTGCMPSRRSLLRRHRLCLFCGLDCSLLEVDMRHSRLSGSRQETQLFGAWVVATRLKTRGMMNATQLLRARAPRPGLPFRPSIAKRDPCKARAVGCLDIAPQAVSCTRSSIPQV